MAGRAGCRAGCRNVAGGRVTDAEERELKGELMKTQIELYRVQLRWEPWKALAAMVAAAAVFAGGVLAVSSWSRPPAPQTVNVHLDAPLGITK
jgi:hypothetical protein